MTVTEVSVSPYEPYLIDSVMYVRRIYKKFFKKRKTKLQIFNMVEKALHDLILI